MTHRLHVFAASRCKRTVYAMYANDILNAMELSALAYRDTQPLMSADAFLLIDDPQTDVQCFVRKQGDSLGITFRGSNTGRDWQTNLAFRKKVIPYGNTASPIRVHGGFLEAYKSPAVRDVLHKQMHGVRRVQITGHSQGAALSILCAVDLEYNFPDREYEVLLFGSPRVGNRAFQRSYNKRVFNTLRVENGNDIVTKIPFVLFGYRHVGMRFPVGASRLPLLFSAAAHYPQAYYKNLLERLL